MAMGASLTIKNHTGHPLFFFSVLPVNDDATFSGISFGDQIQSGGQKTLAMANASVFFAPKGVGADLRFLCLNPGHEAAGNVYFSDPAVGSPTFHFGNQPVFLYTETNPNGNAYVIDIKLRPGC
jgi:hypothetical protein